MNIRKLHDIVCHRMVYMVLVTSVAGWGVVGIGALAEVHAFASFVFPPTSVVQAGFGVFIAGFVTLLFLPIYWVQSRLFGDIMKRHDYVCIISVANAYAFGAMILLFLVGLVSGTIAPPVFLVSPGIYLALALLKKVVR